MINAAKGCESMAELWDIYDKNRIKTGRLHRRGDPLSPGDYHLVVHLWIENSRGEYLIQRRQTWKPLAPGMWDCAVAGSAIAGDDSLAAVLRETREELGVTLDPEALRLLCTIPFDRGFDDIWYTRLDLDAAKLALQYEEVAEARWATEAEIRALTKAGQFLWYDHYAQVPRWGSAPNPAGVSPQTPLLFL